VDHGAWYQEQKHCPGVYWAATNREAGTSEHSALEHLAPVDMPFDDAGVPGQGQPGDDRVALSGTRNIEGLARPP
jgi:hypothetical protein